MHGPVKKLFGARGSDSRIGLKFGGFWGAKLLFLFATASELYSTKRGAWSSARALGLWGCVELEAFPLKLG